MNSILTTVLLLVGSNVFMTFAWYGHLRTLGNKPLIVAILVSWGIALFEYILQVPANRLGFGKLTLPQLKMLQEVITLSVFVPFSIYYMRQPVRLDFLWAGICMCGAVFFMFRSLPGGSEQAPRHAIAQAVTATDSTAATTTRDTSRRE